MSSHVLRGTLLSVGLLLTTATSQGQKTSADPDAFLSKKNLGAWIKDLDGQTSEARRRSAAFALGQIGFEASGAVPALKHVLANDSSAKVREAAAFSLGQIALASTRTANDKELVPLLVKALKDSSWPVRRSAAYALGCLEKISADAQEPLEAALRDETPQVRQNAAWALGRLGPEVIPRLREALRDTDAYVKRDAAQSLNFFEPTALRPAMNDLLALCRDDNSEVRRAAVAVLIRVVGPKDAESAAVSLQGVLGDKDEEIRTNAALALANIGGKESAKAVPVLVDAMLRGQIELRRQAAAAIRNIGPEAVRAVPDLIKALKDPDTEMRKNAAIALSGIGPAADKAVLPLVQLLTDVKDKEEPRMAAAFALSRIGPVPAAIESLPQVLGVIGNSADNANVRLRSVWAIRVHDRNLNKMDGVFPALAKVFKETKTEGNRMLRHDCAYMLGVLQGREVNEEVMDALLDFLKDNKVQVYETTQASLQSGGGLEAKGGAANIKEIGRGDGRVMATQALKEIGVTRIRQRQDIIRQLQVLVGDPETFADLKKDCQVILKAAGQ